MLVEYFFLSVNKFMSIFYMPLYPSSYLNNAGSKMKFINHLIDDVPDELHAKRTAHNIFIIITLSIFFIETLIMLLLSFVLENLPVYTILLDSTILTLAISPLLYYFYVKPLIINISKRSINQQNMISINKKLNIESQRLFKVLDGLPASVHLLDRNHKIRFANKYFRDNFGEIKEEPCYKLLFGKDTPCQVCNTFEVFYKKSPHIRETTRFNGRVYNTYNYPFIDTDGTELVLQLGIDITDRKKAEEELGKREKQLSLIINSMSDTLYTIDRDERLTAIYGDGLKKLGIRSDKFIGKKVSELFEPEKIENFRTAFKEVLDGKDTLLSWETQLPQGNYFFQNSLSPVFGEKGKVISITGIARNITEQKMLEKKITETEKLMAMARMTAMISHEFRNSLTSVRMILELLEESVERNNSDKKSLMVALESVNNMESVVSQLLAFSRPSKVVFEKILIQKILDDSILLVTPQLNKNNIQLNKTCDPDIPLIQADAVKLKESFVNLLLNAIQAITGLENLSDKMINVSVKIISLIKPVWNMSSYQDALSDETNIIWEEKFGQTLAAGSKCLLISFMDSGKGINQEDLKQIFDPFFTTHKEGTGLGLATVKRTIFEHNGVITVNSSKNTGTVFNLYFSM